jgi:hypothetical protein
VIFSDFYPGIIVTCVILKVFFVCFVIFSIKKKRDFYFSLYLAKIFGYFFPLYVLFWFLVLNVMNVQFHIGSCKMITALFLHTVRFFFFFFFSSYYCISEISVMSLVFHVGFGCPMLVMHNYESFLVETCEKGSRSHCM